MRLMPSLPSCTWRTRKSFQAAWSMPTLLGADAAQRCHSSALGAASAASENAINRQPAPRRMGVPSLDGTLRPRVGRAVLEPAQQVVGDFVAAGVVEQLVPRAGIDLHG